MGKQEKEDTNAGLDVVGVSSVSSAVGAVKNVSSRFPIAWPFMHGVWDIV